MSRSKRSMLLKLRGTCSIRLQERSRSYTRKEEKENKAKQKRELGSCRPPPPPSCHDQGCRSNAVALERRTSRLGKYNPNEVGSSVKLHFRRLKVSRVCPVNNRDPGMQEILGEDFGLAENKIGSRLAPSTSKVPRTETLGSSSSLSTSPIKNA